MIEQGSITWKQQRCGKVTASRIADVMARTKTGWGASRANYMAELACERLTGNPTEFFVTDAMRRGTEMEAKARAAYEFHRDVDVGIAEFVPHPTISMAGASPDGYVGDDGLIEIKCPGSAKHIATLLGGSIDGTYVKQMQFQMACTGRQWCHFVSFDDRLPPEMQIFIKRVPRDEALIAEIKADVVTFLLELDRMIADLQFRFSMQEAA